MRLVDHKPNHIAGEQQFFNGAGAELFGRDVQKRGKPARHTVKRFGALDGAEQSVHRDRIDKTLFVEVVYLILHQGLERGDHDRQSVGALPCHQRGELKGDGFPAARRKNGKQGFSVHRRLRRTLL